MNPTDSSFEFEPIDAPFGAFVHGLSPDGLGNRDVDRLQAGLLEHGLLVFRGRAIEAAELVAIGRAFGELESYTYYTYYTYYTCFTYYTHYTF